MIREEAYADRKTDGKIGSKIEDILYFLKKRSIVSEGFEKRIGAETDETILRKWLKLAGNKKGIEELKTEL